MTYDVAVLGGGPGGYATALRAAGHGLRVAIVEADEVGGTCLHRGCVPSKALLRVAHLADQVTDLEAFGLARPGSGLDLGAVGRYRDGIVAQLTKGLRHLVSSRGVDVIQGRGWIADLGRIAVEDSDLVEARNVVVATGSAPGDLPGVRPDGRRVLRSDDVLRLETVPRSAAVIGGGAVGVEVASLWRSLGADVAVIEVAERLLPLEDPDSSAALERAFSGRGIGAHVGSGVSSVSVDDLVHVHLNDGTTIDVEQVLVAVGRRPATRGCGLEDLGVLDQRGFVAVDPLGKTEVEGVWAVGDAIDTLALAHAAFAEGFVVADAIAGLDVAPIDHSRIPRVTYCAPEVASVGLTEPEARDRYADVKTVKTTLTGNARALIEGGGGQMKLVADATGMLLGAHLVGTNATEIIAQLSIATGWDALASELGAIVHAHPTLSESVREAALSLAGSPFHLHT